MDRKENKRLKCGFRGELMKLEKKYNQNNGEYYCDLTRKLDLLCGYTVTNPRYKHYIYDTRDLWDNCLAIRIPGRTIGSIEVDTNSVITNISFYTDLLDGIYPTNIYGELEAYVGVTLEM